MKAVLLIVSPRIPKLLLPFQKSPGEIPPGQYGRNKKQMEAKKILCDHKNVLANLFS